VYESQPGPRLARLPVTQLQFSPTGAQCQGGGWIDLANSAISLTDGKIESGGKTNIGSIAFEAWRGIRITIEHN